MLESNWRDLYRAAILELDPSVLKIRAKIAVDEIKARASDAGVSRDERTELGAALATLRRLKPRQQQPFTRGNR
jgi:hypothetical protein